MDVLAESELMMRLGCAVVLGACLGLEREFKRKPAGIRTFMLVTLGTATFAIISYYLSAYYAVYDATVSIDPSRIVQGIITGIGFLGAGAIMRSDGDVKGVATGADIWFAGAVGICCGYGFYALAIITTLLALGILIIMGAFRVRYRDDIDSEVDNTNLEKTD